MTKENRFRSGRGYLKRDSAKLRNVKRNALEGRPFGSSRKLGYCDTDFDGLPDLFIKKYRNPAVRKSVECNYSDFANLGLLEPTLSRSSGGTCESTHSDNNIDGLYCPDLEYGGFLQTTFYHNARATPYSEPNHQLTTEFKSAIFDEVVLGEWYHVAFTRSGYTGAMYINGQLTSVSTIIKNNALKSSPSSIRIGAVASSNWKNDNAFDGRIDQPAVWGRDLSGAEISKLYNAGSGLEYAQWSGDLTSGAEHVIEFGEVGTQQTIARVGAQPITSIYRNETQLVDPPTGRQGSGGKVSPTSFFPVYYNNIDGFAISETVPRAALVLPKGLESGPAASWTLAAWVKPEGHGATSQGQAVNFDYKGVTYKRAYGTIFSEYNAYQNWSQTSPDANFVVSFQGLI